MLKDNRRKFLKKVSGATGAVMVAPFLSAASCKSIPSKLKKYDHFTADELATNEEFWYQVKQAYTVSTNMVNLNNGGVSPSPKVVQDAVERYNQLSNEAPSYYMWRILDKNKEGLRVKLANLAGASSEEIAINRNASEALETVIFGLRLNRGDEVVLTKQDYPHVINAWKQRAHRDGIVLKMLSFDFPIEDKSAIISKFKNAFTSKTSWWMEHILLHMLTSKFLNWVVIILEQVCISGYVHLLEVGCYM